MESRKGTADYPSVGTAGVPVGQGSDAPDGSGLGSVSSRRTRWHWIIAAGVVLALAVGVLAVVLGGNDRPIPRDDNAVDSSSLQPTRDNWKKPIAGVFRGTKPDEVAGYEKWLGRPIEVVTDFSARANWWDISRPEYLVADWEGQGRRLALGVAMLPEEVDGVSIQQGASGEYDKYYRTLGEELVKHGHADAILRIGWEFNLAGSRWATEDAGAFVKYWQRIVTAMRGVGGQEFRFDWTVNNGSGNAYDAVQYYPGDEYVDYVGVDTYDQSGAVYPIPDRCVGDCAQKLRKRAWQEYIYGGERGLRFWSMFAADRGKQMSIPEWGVWDRVDGTGGGDNPYYIEQMAAFISDPANRVGYQAYFESTNDLGTHRLWNSDRFPKARQRYLELFGG